MINKEINEQDFYFALKAWQDNVLIEKIDNASLDVILEKIIEEIKSKIFKDRFCRYCGIATRKEE